MNITGQQIAALIDLHARRMAGTGMDPELARWCAVVLVEGAMDEARNEQPAKRVERIIAQIEGVAA